jgi:hypothetical protein
MLLKIFHKIQMNTKLPNSFYEAKLRFQNQIRSQNEKKKKLYPISLMNIDDKNPQ